MKFEISDIPQNYIYADKDIVNTVALLNKKGYATRASCADHPTIEFTQWGDEKENLDNYMYKILIKLENPEDFRKDIVIFQKVEPTTSVYVMFEKEYEFKDLPKGFINEGRIIRKEIELFDENKNAYEYQSVMEKIEKANNDLFNWALTVENAQKNKNKIE